MLSRLLDHAQHAADPRNAGSLRVMEKLGMQREALLRQNRLHRGEWVDEVWCGLLRSEWDATRNEQGQSSGQENEGRA